MRTWIALMTLTAAVSAAELPPAAQRPVDYEREIKPLLAKHCGSCHADQKRESGLRLDRRADLLQGGDTGKAVLPGKSQESRLIHYVAGLDPEHVMPPEGPRLTADQVGLLRAWIDQGCQFPDSPLDNGPTHWAYQPLKDVAAPDVPTSMTVYNPIDQFVRAELVRRQIAPAPEADRVTLIRRLSLDLTGLPPSIADVDTFAADARPDAYELLVDRLLDSPHFGERWGRHWLDMARYADSDGYEKDNPRPEAYRWRDWVIQSINDDLPFDEFTIQQLAGDLLPNATLDQRLATAFHRQTLTNTEGGTDQEQFRIEACFDRTETTGAIWLGLTVGCARCHSHKYDAITQREYYQLFAVFNNGDEQNLTLPKSPEEVAAYQQAKTAHDAEVAVATARLRDEQSRLAPQLAAWEERLQRDLAEAAAQPVTRHSLESPHYACDSDVSFQPQSDGSVLVGGNNPERAVYTITGQLKVPALHAVRLDVFPDPSLPSQGPGRVAHGNFVLSEMTVEVSTDAEFREPRQIEFRAARADFEQGDKPWKAANVIDGKDDTGWAIAPQMGKPHWASFDLKDPLRTPAELFVRVKLSQQYGAQHTLGRFRITFQSGIDASAVVPEPIAAILKVPADRRTEAQRNQMRDSFSQQEPSTRELVAKLDALKKKEPARPEMAVRVLAQRGRDPRPTYVLRRGEFLDPIKELAVTPAALSVLPPLTSRTGAVADRLDLARWLVSPQNPLTPRVTVNHAWRILFGAGLVRTANDFGVRGDRPTHPELLDWLAREFIGQGADPNSSSGTVRYRPGQPWSRKSLIKRIVMSATYRQSSQHRPEVDLIDPQNLWLARQNRLRVEAEIVRDLSLDVAGLLTRKVGGPSVFPPLPPGIAELSYAGNFKWTTSTGDDRFRRGLYTFFKRTAPHPNLTLFDCPDANLTCLERRTSNTPLQALTALNNETFAESARALARRLIAVSADDASRLETGFRLCVARRPDAAEHGALQSLLNDSRAWYATHPEDARQLVARDAASGVSPSENAAWVATARILLNLDEFITRE